MSRREFLKIAAVGTAANATAMHATPSHAQEETAWLLGEWEGSHKPLYVLSTYEDSALFTFFKKNGQMQWKVERTVRSSGTHYLYASGRVLKATDSAVELTGQYDVGTTTLSYVGKRNTYSLTPSSSKDELSGTFLGADNISMPVKITKKSSKLPGAGKK